MSTDYLPCPAAPPTIFQPGGPPKVTKIPESRYPGQEAPSSRSEAKKPGPSPAPPPRPPPERPQPKPKVAGAPKERIPHTKAEPRERPNGAKEVPKSSSSEPSQAATADTSFSAALPAVAGTVVRISGLKATPQLNGELGQIVGVKEDQPDRTIVRTSFGEKALKQANIEVGFSSVCPRGTVVLIGALLVITIVSCVDIFLGSSGMQVGVLMPPALAFLWLVSTFSLCIYLYRPCRPEGTWVPAMSDLGAAAPARKIWLVGLIVVSLLLASSTWLYGEILVPRLADVPDPPEPMPTPAPTDSETGESSEESESDAQAQPTAAAESDAQAQPAAAVEEDNSTKLCSEFSTSDTCPSRCFWTAGWIHSSCEALQACSALLTSEACTNQSHCTWQSGWLSSSCEVMQGCSTFSTWETCPSYCRWNAGWLSSTCEAIANSTEDNQTNQTTNRTRIPDRIIAPPPEWMIQRSIMYGYVAAAAVGVQCIFKLQERLLSPQSVLHILGAVVFAVSAMQHCQQSTLLLSSVRGEPIRSNSEWVVSFVKFRRQIGDFAPLVLLAVPLASQMFNREKDTRRPTMQSALQSSGLLTSAKAIQWGSLLLYTVFVSTYALDFWVCGGFLLSEEELEG